MEWTDCLNGRQEQMDGWLVDRVFFHYCFVVDGFMSVPLYLVQGLGCQYFFVYCSPFLVI